MFVWLLHIFLSKSLPVDVGIPIACLLAALSGFAKLFHETPFTHCGNKTSLFQFPIPKSHYLGTQIVLFYVFNLYLSTSKAWTLNNYHLTSPIEDFCKTGTFWRALSSQHPSG